jgi:hypothetical protein
MLRPARNDVFGDLVDGDDGAAVLVVAGNDASDLQESILLLGNDGQSPCKSLAGQAFKSLASML